ERQTYRPGQTVYFRGILRHDDDGAYTLPTPGAVVTLTALDSQGRQFYQADVPLSALGTFDGQIALDESASTGYYQLQAEYNEEEGEPGYYFGAPFQVAEYRKPEFEVTVTLDSPDYVNGDTIQTVAEARYYFGGPVSGAVVRWRVFASPYVFDRWQGPAGEGSYSFADYDEADTEAVYAPGGIVVTEGEGEMDAEGLFEFLLPADIAERSTSQVFTVEVSVQDVDNQEVSGRSSANVHKGEFYIGLSPVGYVGSVGEEQAVRVVTVDTQGQVHSSQTLDVLISEREWLSVREMADDGYYYWTSKVRETPVATQTVTTDDSGIAMVTFTPPKGGTYKVAVSGLDSRENRVRSAAYVWVSDSEFVGWRQENNDRINLVADRESYHPGDMAKVLIPSPYQGSTMALLTIERGKIIEHKLLTLHSNSELLNIPILPTYAPNVYVSVVIVKGMDETSTVPGFKLGYVMLPVSAEQQELKVSITPQGAEGGAAIFRPRDTVVFDVATEDYQGKGVSAEVSLQLVDLAVEALATGSAQNIVDTFYRERMLGVQTATTLAVSVDRHNLDRASGGKGGGGADVGQLMVRQDLPDTAFWAPAVLTDSTGHATVEVTLPDNLTTWRMTAQAVTPATKVGVGTGDIVSTLDVMIRPVAPRFLVIGDKPILGAVVHNNTSETLKLEAVLQATGAELKAPAAASLDV
ncbi:MAG: alpha-2-macroglobulin, partial [Chloroflexi bacterium]|nr:alpha-2-macroglobulin [Chloroflexota bacterium]